MADHVDSILDRGIEGNRLSREDLQVLFDDADLLRLGQAAAAVRDRLVDPTTATFIVDRNINYTNVCVYRCRFCAFYRKTRDTDAYVLPFDVIADKVAETVAAGGTGILLQGGVHPDLGIEFYEDLLRNLKRSFPQIHLHAFSVPEIWFVSKIEKMPVREVISRLMDAGLSGLQHRSRGRGRTVGRVRLSAYACDFAVGVRQHHPRSGLLGDPGPQDRTAVTLFRRR